MITPKKHLHLDTSVIRISALLLRELRKRRAAEFETLRGRILKIVGPDGDFAFLPALSFLYLLGRIEYHAKNDSFEYLEG